MEFKTLIKKRGSYKARLTQFKAYLEVVQSCHTLTTLQINELNIRLTKLEELYSDFDCTQGDIENECEFPDEQYTEREAFETQYFGAIAVAREMLSKRAPPDFRSAAGSGTVSGHAGGPKLKLPTIHLPTYTGQYHDWLEFRDTYTSLIHSDETIPKISKFHYLRAAVKDSAALIIRSLDFSAENYDIAWQLLCDRYDNKRLLVNNITDIVNRNLRALKTLNLPTEGWDLLVIHIVANKLDSLTSREWEGHRSTLNDLPTLVEFNKFLKNRADLLEALDETHNNVVMQRRHSDNTHVRQRSFTLRSHSPPSRQSFACPLCKNQHAIYQCLKFKSLPIETRIQKAKLLKLCLNCLRHGHSSNQCRLGTCRICHKRHNTLLHITEPVSTHYPMQASVTTTPTAGSSSVTHCAVHPAASHRTHSHNNPQDNVAMSAIHKQCVVLLSTALIQVNDYNGQSHTIRALLDNGSTSSFITEDLRAKLRLPTASTSTLVEGLNCQSSCISQRCDVIISSLINTYIF